jgi:4'-phosphopantetheinyl transferase
MNERPWLGRQTLQHHEISTISLLIPQRYVDVRSSGEILTPNLSDLSERVVHVWSMHTRAPQDICERFDEVLSEEEKRRAAQLRSCNLRDCHRLAAGAVRMLLAGYIGGEAGGVGLVRDNKGKPRLAKAGCSLHFSVSHSGYLAVFAFTAGCEVGIDVEQIRPIDDVQLIAGRYFTPEEAGVCRSLERTESLRAFFRCWVSKEAYLKATGDGLSAPLDGFQVTCLEKEPARIVHIQGNRDAAREWRLHDLAISSGYLAAVAYRDDERGLVLSRLLEPIELLNIYERRRSPYGRNTWGCFSKI